MLTYYIFEIIFFSVIVLFVVLGGLFVNVNPKYAILVGGYKSKLLYFFVVLMLCGLLGCGNKSYFLVLNSEFNYIFYDYLLALCLLCLSVFFMFLCVRDIQGWYEYTPVFIFVITVLFVNTLFGCCVDFFGFYIVLELQTLLLYVLYTIQTGYSSFFIKNGIRFFVLSVFFSLLLLLGIACLYLTKGSIVFNELSYIRFSSNDFLFLFGVSLIFVVLFFKLGVFPFHLWALEVFVLVEGPLFLLYSVFSKIPVLYMFVKFIFCLGYNDLVYHVGFWSVFLGVLSLYIENDLNRFMVYSSMVQHGLYLLCLSGSNLFILSGLVYIYINYVVFSCIFYMCVYENTRSTYLGAISGLYHVKPIDGFVIVSCVFSLSGVPITLGFLGKFNLLKGLAYDGLMLLVFFVVLFSILSSVYYLNIIRLVVFGKLQLFFLHESALLTLIRVPVVITSGVVSIVGLKLLFKFVFEKSLTHVRWLYLF